MLWAQTNAIYFSVVLHSFRDAHDLHSHPSLPQTLNAPSLPIYLFLSFVFSILPVGFHGTSPKKTFRGRLYFGSFSQYRRISSLVRDLPKVSPRRSQVKMVVIPHEAINTDDGSITMMGGFRVIFETA